jgi:hypothetical protein
VPGAETTSRRSSTVRDRPKVCPGEVSAAALRAGNSLAQQNGPAARAQEGSSAVRTFIAQYGYLAIFLLMLAESACVPIPSEVTMPLGGALAAGAVAGSHLNLIVVVAAGVAGNLAGSYLAWGSADTAAVGGAPPWPLRPAATGRP